MTALKKFPVIVGLGATGLSCARYLATLGVPFAITDSRVNPPGLDEIKQTMPQVLVSVGGFDEALLSQASEIILSQGVPLKDPVISDCRKQGIPVIGDMELFARQNKTPVVAITGSNAKSTVTTLVGEIGKRAGLKVKVGGNLGPPVLDLLLDQEQPDYYVLEISNFQLEVTSSLQASIATILNISPDHLDCYDGFSDYVAAKQRVYQHCDTAVFNRDDLLTFPENKDIKQFRSFGLSEPEEGEYGIRQIADKIYLCRGDVKLLSCQQLALWGRHNWANSLAAIAIAQQMSIPLGVILEVLKEFAGLPHRCQKIAVEKGVTWYNDSKGTNVGATCAALSGLGPTIPGKIVWLAGGLAKDGDFQQLIPFAQEFMRQIILFGQDAKQIAEAMIPAEVPIVFVKDLAHGVELANRKAEPGDMVLLSPACASFDMFSNYAHRGEVFCQLVKELIHG